MLQTDHLHLLLTWSVSDHLHLVIIRILISSSFLPALWSNLCMQIRQADQADRTVSLIKGNYVAGWVLLRPLVYPHWYKQGRENIRQTYQYYTIQFSSTANYSLQNHHKVQQKLNNITLMKVRFTADIHAKLSSISIHICLRSDHDCNVFIRKKPDPGEISR